MTRSARGALFGAAVALTLATGCDASSTGSGGSSPVPAASSSPAAPSSVTSTSTGTPVPTASTATSSVSSPSAGTTTASAPDVTAQVVVRPVTSTGTVVSGWTVRRSSTTIDCSGALRSPVSQSADVLFCSPSAASATACWHASDRSRAYCLPDPRQRVLVEYHLQGGTFPAAHPVELPPAPASLDLVGGTRCSVRDGGAAARLDVHPEWVPYYFCGTSGSTAVWAAQDSADGGVTRGDGLWAVQVAATDGSGPLRTSGVASAYFVGTA